MKLLVTHVAGSSTKTMLNGGQHGVAIGAAAFMCKKSGTTPRNASKEHIQQLQEVVFERGEYRDAPKTPQGVGAMRSCFGPNRNSIVVGGAGEK